MFQKFLYMNIKKNWLNNGLATSLLDFKIASSCRISVTRNKNGQGFLISAMLKAYSSCGF